MPVPPASPVAAQRQARQAAVDERRQAQQVALNFLIKTGQVTPAQLTKLREDVKLQRSMELLSPRQRQIVEDVRAQQITLQQQVKEAQQQFATEQAAARRQTLEARQVFDRKIDFLRGEVEKLRDQMQKIQTALDEAQDEERREALDDLRKRTEIQYAQVLNAARQSRAEYVQRTEVALKHLADEKARLQSEVADLKQRLASPQLLVPTVSDQVKPPPFVAPGQALTSIFRNVFSEATPEQVKGIDPNMDGFRIGTVDDVNYDDIGGGELTLQATFGSRR